MIGSSFFALIRFVVLVITDLSMLPALQIMQRNHRHFELFIGIFQLIISLLFNLSEVIGVRIFLEELQWHFISDVLSITYFLLLCVHLMGIPEENTNIILRYVAFALSWLSKSKDGWDSTLFEVLLVVVYVGGVLFCHLGPKEKRPPIRMEHAKKAVMACGACIVPLLISWMGFIDWDPFHLTVGFFHIAAGIACYFAWQAIPCRDTKKHDDYMPMHSAFK